MTVNPPGNPGPAFTPDPAPRVDDASPDAEEAATEAELAEGAAVLKNLQDPEVDAAIESLKPKKD